MYLCSTYVCTVCTCQGSSHNKVYTLHKQLSSNTDVTMLVTVCEPLIRSQCATTEAVARNANLNLTSSDVTHVMLTI